MRLLVWMIFLPSTVQTSKNLGYPQTPIETIWEQLNISQANWMLTARLSWKATYAVFWVILFENENFLIQFFISVITGAEPNEISWLFLLWNLRMNGNYTTMSESHNAAQHGSNHVFVLRKKKKILQKKNSQQPLLADSNKFPKSWFKNLKRKTGKSNSTREFQKFYACRIKFWLPQTHRSKMNAIFGNVKSNCDICDNKEVTSRNTNPALWFSPFRHRIAPRYYFIRIYPPEETSLVLVWEWAPS